jgi:cell division septation protein DedD
LLRVLAFDGDAGSLAAVDTAERLVRIDLRLGSVAVVQKTPLHLAASVDGRAIYGVNDSGFIVRLTPTGEAWRVLPPGKPSALLPQQDGTLLVLGEERGTPQLWRWRPPRPALETSAAIPATIRVVPSSVGDRIWLLQSGGVDARKGKDLSDVGAVSITGGAIDAVPTPSGDRVYVASSRVSGVPVIDRYRGEIKATIPFSSPASALRMDAVGRLLLARSSRGDTTWVVETAAGRPLGALAGLWRDDLPVVAPDGGIVSVRGADVIVSDGASLRSRGTIERGAADRWIIITWSGFRPRAAGLDGPPRFAESEAVAGPIDSAIAALAPVGARDSSKDVSGTKSGTMDSPIVGTTPGASQTTTGTVFAASGSANPNAGAPGAVVPPAPTAYLTSFAALVSEDRARALADSIRVSGSPARVIGTPGTRGTIYRVVLGPFPVRSDADKAGRAAGRDYWIVESRQ